MTLESLINLVDDISGADPLKNSRARPVIIARTLLVNILFEEGYSEHAVGEMIGFSRDTIHHYRRLMQDARKYNNDAVLIKKWDELQKVLALQGGGVRETEQTAREAVVTAGRYMKTADGKVYIETDCIPVDAKKVRAGDRVKTIVILKYNEE